MEAVGGGDSDLTGAACATTGGRRDGEKIGRSRLALSESRGMRHNRFAGLADGFKSSPRAGACFAVATSGLAPG
jgi:hypothetical protein